ncbi:MAG TPA: glycerol-3-phosphate 1-O-acyltransferase PlsY [Candidatus Acidoferrales bacterium]|nr:glycerol-3-phosphate 1-O-acyltransferase PlsY [Candidatus Acidoferrales bacterium]
MNSLPLSPALLIPVTAYLLGSIPFGLLVVKALGGPDIRAIGSGNIGAANVTRSAGKFAGILTLLLDAGKGYAAVWLAAHQTRGNIRWMMVAAVCAIIGHMFPVWLGFKGGKGVATGLGVFLPIAWQAVAAGIVLWLLVVIFWRYSSLGSISAAVALPLFVYLLYAPGHAPPEFVSLGTVVISVLVLIKHRPNIARLVAGEEPRLNFGGKNDE